MSKFLIDLNRNYTHMPKYHLRDPRLSLRAKGLLSWMLSLPEDWDYSVAGLAKCCVEGREAVRKVVQELEAAGYVDRLQARGGGRFDGYDYILHEQSTSAPPSPGNLGDGDSPSPRILGTGLLGTGFPGDGHKDEELYINNKNNTPLPPTGERRGHGSRGGRHRSPPRTAPDWKPERFAGFWSFYRGLPGENGKPRNENKQRAMDAWDALRPDDALIDTIARALVKQAATDMWQRGVGIPQAATYLNNSRWTDAEDLPAPPRESVPDSGTGRGPCWNEEAEK